MTRKDKLVKVYISTRGSAGSTPIHVVVLGLHQYMWSVLALHQYMWSVLGLHQYMWQVLDLHQYMW